MGLRVNTNVLSLNAQRNLSNVSSRIGGNFARLSSGSRIAVAADDAAGLGVSERMRAQIRSLSQAGRNANDGISLVQTAESSLSELNNNLVRMRELAVQSANGTLSDDDRAVLDTEFTALISEISRVAADTDFNGVSLFDGTNSSITLQIGADNVAANDQISISLTEVTAGTDGLDVSALSVATDTGAQTALSAIDTAIDSVTTFRGDLGAQQNRLQSVVRSIANTTENLTAAESRIRDVDVAYETADLTRNSILQQAAVSVLSQANQQPQLALSLLG